MVNLSASAKPGFAQDLSLDDLLSIIKRDYKFFLSVGFLVFGILFYSYSTLSIRNIVLLISVVVFMIVVIAKYMK